MEVYIDGIRYIPSAAHEHPLTLEECRSGRILEIGDYVRVVDIAHYRYDVGSGALGETGKVVAWPHDSSFIPGQLAVELPGHSFHGSHVFGFWPSSLEEV